MLTLRLFWISQQKNLFFSPSMNDEFDSEDEEEKAEGTVGTQGMKDHPLQWISV